MVICEWLLFLFILFKMRPFENYHKGEKRERAFVARSLPYFLKKGGELVECNLIRGGFSFCGIDIADLGLSYAPELEDTYIYHPSETTVHEETFDGHDGGYFYGASKKPKEFTLRCYFENSTIDRGIMERINHLFRTGKSGKLIFNRKPWQYYYATVTSLPHPELNNYMNGLITITMKAYYPVARGDDMYYLPNMPKYDLVMESTALLEEENIVPDTSFANLETIKGEPYSLLLHNPGTEYSPVSITAAGDAGLGVIIRNKTTNQECKIVAMTKATTSDAGKSVYIDGVNGLTMLISGSESKPAFLYHDYGFIHLEPAYPAVRNIYADTCNGNIVTLVNTLYDNVKGHYIWLNGWYKIIEMIDANTLELDKSVISMPNNRTIITKMNEIEIEPIDTMNFTHLSFSYKPNYA